MGLIGTHLVQNIWHISTCSLCRGPPVSNSSSSSTFSAFSDILHSEESVLMTGISGCFTVLFVATACLKGVLAPDAGGVLLAELSDDLFSTEHLRLRNPKFAGPTASVGFGAGLKVCGSALGFDGVSGSDGCSDDFDGESVS